MTLVAMTRDDAASETHNALEVIVARDAGALAPLAREWDALAGGVPFRTHCWALSWWRHYQQENCQLMVALVVDADGKLVGVAPWYLETSARAGRVLRLLGSGEVCSDYQTVLCREDLVAPVAACLADWLAYDVAERWQMLDLAGVADADPVVAELGRQMAARGHVVDRRVDANTWSVELPADWDQYLSTLSRTRRERTRQLLRRLIDSGRAVVHQVRDSAELDRAFDVLIELHQRRRQSLDQPGCFASPRFTTFHRDVARQLLAAGQLRLRWIELDGHPIAAEYSLVGGTTVYYYQGGFEPDAANERPGWLAFATSLQSAINSGLHTFDFLRGDEAYKASWGAKPKPLVRVRIIGRQPAARARYATWRSSQTVKSWARRWLRPSKEASE